MMIPKKTRPGFRVRAAWAFVAIDRDDDEGVPAVQTTDGRILPLLCFDQERLDQLRTVARRLAQEQGVRMELRKFSGPMETLEVFEP